MVSVILEDLLEGVVIFTQKCACKGDFVITEQRGKSLLSADGMLIVW